MSRLPAFALACLCACGGPAPGLDAGLPDAGLPDAADAGGTEASDAGDLACRPGGSDCDTDAQCCTGLACRSGTCDLPGCIGDTCTRRSDCCETAANCGSRTSSGSLTCARACFNTNARCTVAADCCAGLECTLGRCQAPTCEGDTCSGACCGAAPFCGAASSTGTLTCASSCFTTGQRCVSSGDCCAGTSCVGGTCALPGCEGRACTSAGQCCNASPYCGARTSTGSLGCLGTCVEESQRCSASTDCCAGLRCESGTCRAAPIEHPNLGQGCVTHPDCGDPSLLCYLWPGGARGFCAMACTADRDCGTDGFCSGNVCYRDCLWSECAAGTECWSWGACQPSCTGGTEFCGSAWSCQPSGECRYPTCGGAFADCTSRSECCEATPNCLASTAGGQRVCRSICGAAGMSCGSDPDCCSGLACTNGTCGSAGCDDDVCSTSADCCATAPFCSGLTGSLKRCQATCGATFEQCSVNADCCDGFTCQNGSCKRPTCTGAFCVSGGHCCESAPFCTGTGGNTVCSTTCGPAGASCGVSPDCCAGNGCVSGTCRPLASCENTPCSGAGTCCTTATSCHGDGPDVAPTCENDCGVREERCLADDDCCGAYVCRNGICDDRQSCTGQACNRTADADIGGNVSCCNGSAYCWAEAGGTTTCHIRPAPAGARCTSSESCGVGMRCVSGTCTVPTSCAARTCTSAADCCADAPNCWGTGTKRCSALCGPMGSDCTLNSDCCSTSCGNGGHCAGPLVCANGTGCVASFLSAWPTYARASCCGAQPYCLGDPALPSAFACSSSCGNTGRACRDTGDCCAGLTCRYRIGTGQYLAGRCESDQGYCNGESCILGAANGGCCADAPFCVSNPNASTATGRSDTVCSALCGAPGAKCRADSECCSITCDAGMCL